MSRPKRPHTFVGDVLMFHREKSPKFWLVARVIADGQIYGAKGQIFGSYKAARAWAGKLLKHGGAIYEIGEDGFYTTR